MKEINLGHILIENRHKRGITQDELASYIGVSKAAVSKWETPHSHLETALLVTQSFSANCCCVSPKRSRAWIILLETRVHRIGEIVSFHYCRL